MEGTEEKKSSWGGAREGSGRKKKYVKTCFFSATEQVAAIIEALPRNERADFINQAILKAAGGEG